MASPLKLSRAAAATRTHPSHPHAPAELAACRPHLEAELALLRDVRVVIVLGRIAWEGWLRASGWWERLPARERPPFAHGSETRMANGVTLLCSYHPSRQNTNTGTLTRQMWHDVFRRAREIVGG